MITWRGGARRSLRRHRTGRCAAGIVSRSEVRGWTEGAHQTLRVRAVRAVGAHAERNVNSVISDGAPSRMGGPQYPVPRLT